MHRVTHRQPRTPLLIAEFQRFLRVFERNPPFTRFGQLEYHLATIRRRRELGSTAKSIDDDQFPASLYKTLQAWGIGARASNLRPLGAFVDAIRAKGSEIADLDALLIDDPTLNVNAIGERIWRLIDTLGIVANDARIVPGSKALHHLLPELVVPIDRAYTQKFFRWHNPEFQYGQAACFRHAFSAFVEIARRANPAQYVGVGWNSSRTKVIDNALVGMLCEERAAS
jgi:hypothetical protein